MDKIKIITDSASDLSLETAKKYGIHIIPINITLGSKSVKDKYEISNEQFYEYMKSGNEIPKTSQITVAEHIDEFKKFSDDFSVIYVPISSKGSGTYQSAVIARETILEENPDTDITIVDPLLFSYGYGYWVIEAAKMADAGCGVDEIVAMLKDRFARTEIILSVESLDYLQKGGRISPAAKILANVLDISPILTIEDGLVMNRDKVRGRKKIIAKMVDIVNENADHDCGQKIIIMQGNVPEKAEKMRETLLERTDFKDTVTAEIGPCIGTHTGPGAFAFVYLKK